MNDVGIYINVATLVAIVGGIIKLTWGVSSQRAEVDKRVDQVEAEVKLDVVELERRIVAIIEAKERDSVARADTLRKETGEVGAALRTKIHEIETWNRDTFVRRESFEAVVSRLEKAFEKSISQIDEKIDDKFDHMEKLIAAKGQP